MATQNSTLEALNWRYATKEFDTKKPLSKEQENLILESLRLSASSFGLQPWGFVVVRNTTTRDALKKVAWNQNQITDAPLLVVLTTPKKLDTTLVATFIDSVAKTRGVDRANLAQYEGLINSTIKLKGETNARDWAARQVYIAMGTALLAAAENGIDACPIEGFDSAQFNSILGLESLGLDSRAVIAFGMRKETDAYAKNKKVRFSKEEVFIEM